MHVSLFFLLIRASGILLSFKPFSIRSILSIFFFSFLHHHKKNLMNCHSFRTSMWILVCVCVRYFVRHLPFMYVHTEPCYFPCVCVHLCNSTSCGFALLALAGPPLTSPSITVSRPTLRLHFATQSLTLPAEAL